MSTLIKYHKLQSQYEGDLYYNWHSFSRIQCFSMNDSISISYDTLFQKTTIIFLSVTLHDVQGMFTISNPYTRNLTSGSQFKHNCVWSLVKAMAGGLPLITSLTCHHLWPQVRQLQVCGHRWTTTGRWAASSTSSSGGGLTRWVNLSQPRSSTFSLGEQ